MKKEDREGFADYKELIATAKAGRKCWFLRPDYVVMDRRSYEELIQPKLIVRHTGDPCRQPIGYLFKETYSEYSLKSKGVQDNCLPVFDGDLIVIVGKDGK